MIHLNKEKEMLTKTYKDPQGVTHTDAVFQVTHAAVYHNTNKVHHAQPDGTYVVDESENRTLDFSVQFWTNQAAKDAGFEPYMLRNDGFTYNYSLESDVTDPVVEAEARLGAELDERLTGE